MLRTLTKIGLAFAILSWGHALYALDPSDIQWAIATTEPQSAICPDCLDPQDAAPRPSAASGHPAHPAAGVTFDEANLAPDQQPTPMEGVTAGLNALGPLANKTLVVYGSGFDARWEITAAKREPTLKVIGIEIDPEIAESARRYVESNGVADRVTILTGDAITTDVQADIGAAYLFPGTLAELAPKIKQLDRFVSFAHAVPGLAMRQVGDVYVYERHTPQAVMQTFRQGAVWNGRVYSGPMCNRPNCAMCNAIRRQLAASAQTTIAGQSGHYETQSVKVCRRGAFGRKVCTTENRSVWVED